MGWKVNDIPLIGDQLAKVGKIYDIMQQPCSPTPEIWFLAFWYGIPNMLWSLFKPDPLDDVWDRVGGRRSWKRRQKLRFTDQYRNPIPLKPALRWVKFAGDWVQRVGWWFLIVDAAVDHAVYWTSAAYSFEGCKVPGSPYAQGSSDDPQQDSSGDNYKRANVAVTDFHIFTGGIGEVFIPAGYGYYASFEISSEPNDNFPESQRSAVTGWRIRDTQSGVIAGGATDEAVEGGKTIGAGAVKKPIILLHDTTIVFEYTIGGGKWARITGMSINVTGSGVPNSIGQGAG